MNASLFKKLGEEYRREGNWIYHNRTKTSVRIIKPNKDIMYIIGFLADGCLSKRKWKYEIEIHQKNFKLLNKISRLFEKNFQKKPAIKWQRDIYRLRICSKPLYLYLDELYSKSLQHLKAMKYSKYFIAGFADAEGSLLKTKKSLRFAITQADKKILTDISKILNKKYSIHSKIYGPYKHKNSKKLMYYLHLEGKNVHIYFKNVPSLRFFPIPHTMTFLR